MDQVVESLPRKHQALSSNSRTTKTKPKKTELPYTDRRGHHRIKNFGNQPLSRLNQQKQRKLKSFL
jgi:hypothetical protein